MQSRAPSPPIHVPSLSSFAAWLSAQSGSSWARYARARSAEIVLPKSIHDRPECDTVRSADSAGRHDEDLVYRPTLPAEPNKLPERIGSHG